MMRLTSLTAVLLLVVLVFSTPSAAQAPANGTFGTYGIYGPGFYVPGYYGPIVTTPEIHLGSATEPSIVRIPPVIVQTPLPHFEPPEYAEGESMTTAEMRGGFDFVVSPVGMYYPGSMDDGSVSLGEYARQLRSQKHGPPPIVLRP